MRRVRYILPLQKPGHIRGRNRLAEQKSLPEVASVGEQLITLPDGLNTFRDRGDSKAASKPHDRPHDGAITTVRQLAHERPINLEHVDVELLEVCERGEACAEIIKRYADTGLAQRSDDTAHMAGVVTQEDAFGHFELNACRRHIFLRESRQQARGEILAAELRGRGVDRHPPERDVAFQPPAYVGDHTFLHPLADRDRQLWIIESSADRPGKLQAMPGCVHRSKASKPVTRSVRRSNLGW